MLISDSDITGAQQTHEKLIGLPISLAIDTVMLPLLFGAYVEVAGSQLFGDTDDTCESRNVVAIDSPVVNKSPNPLESSLNEADIWWRRDEN
ncbi:MAG: hypothetical protein AAGJ81_07770 [Verrucomicrobiota bacterium]